MNDVGQIELSGVDCSIHISQTANDGDGSITTIISDREPSPSIESGSGSMSSTTLIVPPSSASTPLSINSDQCSNVTPKRPGNLSLFSGKILWPYNVNINLNHNCCDTGRHSSRYRPSNQQQNVQRPLSPIDSSAETTPSESPAPPLRPRFLQLPSLASAQSFFSLRRSSTPTSDVSTSQPATPSSERKHLYEAESPDELALIDAACAYNIRLFQRSVHHVAVSLPGTIDNIAIVTRRKFDYFFFCSQVKEQLNMTFLKFCHSIRHESECRSSCVAQKHGRLLSIVKELIPLFCRV